MDKSLTCGRQYQKRVDTFIIKVGKEKKNKFSNLLQSLLLLNLNQLNSD